MIASLRGLLIATVALIFGVLGLTSSVAAVAMPSPAAATFTYHGHNHIAVFTDTTAERGPPTFGDTKRPFVDAVGVPSRGASACSGGSTALSGTTYDDPSDFVLIACATTTTTESVGILDGDAATLDRPSVAANAGRRVAPDLLRVGELKLQAVPKGAVGTPTQTGIGLEYVIPRGTPEISEKVASVRIMDPVISGKYQYPSGYVSYMNKGGQVVNPFTGETLQPSDPLWHIELP